MSGWNSSRAVLGVLLPTLLGAGAGIAGSLWFSGRQGAAPSRPEVVDVGEAPRPRAPAARGALALADIERRLSHLEERAEDPGGGGEGAPSSDAPAPRTETREERLARATEWHRSRLEAHRTQPTDAAWSTQAARSLQDGLHAVRGSSESFDVVSVDCKTTLCVATLDWADHGHARGASTRVLHHHYEPNCGVELFTPDPEDPGARYRSRVVFDCTEARAQ
ncbi:hypothetical protein WMF04_25780 [Sorangium sp. So ce260]|uniref:hypothetical protein n=1 Tax=Sorangium sp. So ce260 TaxID=3133291 RepID=UPI003F5F04F0